MLSHRGTGMLTILLRYKTLLPVVLDLPGAEAESLEVGVCTALPFLMERQKVLP